MKVNEIAKRPDAESDLEEIFVTLSEAVFASSELQLALESQWVHSGEKDWWYRVDKNHGSIHVHLARERHKSAKNMQASWNDNGSRHDKKTFNTAVGDIQRVRDIATRVLNLGPNVILESEGSAVTSLQASSEVWVSADGKHAGISLAYS